MVRHNLGDTNRQGNTSQYDGHVRKLRPMPNGTNSQEVHNFRDNCPIGLIIMAQQKVLGHTLSTMR